MGGFKIVFFIFGLFLCAMSSSYEEPTSCADILKQGGVRAIVDNLECGRMLLPEEFFQNRNQSMHCQLGTGTLQAHKENFEDQVFCDLDMHIPFLGEYEFKDVKVGLVTVFDNLVGKEADKTTAKLLKDYFLAYTYLLRDATYYFTKFKTQNMEKHGLVYQMLTFWSSRWTLPIKADDTTHLEILKEALLRSIHDIGLTFSEHASRDLHDSRCVATVVLMVEGQILFANGCKSKALLCVDEIRGNLEDEVSWIDLSAMNLESVHHSNINDERSQDKAAVNYAQLQSYSDVNHQSIGVISAPVVTDWQPLPVDDTHLVVATDSVFECLTPHDVCSLLLRGHIKQSNAQTMVTPAFCPIFSPLPAHAHCIVDTAYIYGRMGNLLAVVAQLTSAGFVQPRKIYS